VDVGARKDILDALRRAADGGMAVVVVSSEPEDLAAACDRVLIYREGDGMVEADASAPDVLIDQIYRTDRAAIAATAEGSSS
jgi:ABC-type sugar transport system ATPase subunit